MKPVPRSAGVLAAALGKLVKWFSELQQERISVHVAAPFCNIKMSEKRGVLLTEPSQEAIALSLCQQVPQAVASGKRVTSTWDASEASAAAKASFS